MSQDNGAKKDTSQIAQEETKSWIENRKEDDSKGPDDKTLPPQTDQKLAEDTPPPSSGHHLSGFAIALIIIAAIFIVLGVTCFALMNIK
jgi:hypothetical protein